MPAKCRHFLFKTLLNIKEKDLSSIHLFAQVLYEFDESF